LPRMTLDPTPQPVSAADLKSMLDGDLRQSLTTGDLKPGSPIGMAIGVVKHGESRVLVYGAAKPDSIFEIGSISKTFTGLMLARMVTQGRARLDEPVRELLPPGTVSKPSGHEITLADLATHHSGLPPIPPNYDHSHPHPFTIYRQEQLYEFLRMHGVGKPADAGFEYSNLGMGLLGDALSVRAGGSYGDLLREEITAPMGMEDTALELSADELRRFLRGYDANHHVVDHVQFVALAGAGGLRSSVSDMLTYLEAQLHPEKFPALRDALLLSHRLRENANGGQRIALAWGYVPKTQTYWHNGATLGFTSHAFFVPHADIGAVVLMNMNGGITPMLSPDNVAEHIRQRLLGQPANSLDTMLVPVEQGLRGALRQYIAWWLTMFAAAVFVYGTILGTQGFAALLLPRRVFLRVSGYLQLAVIAVVVGVYFFQPGFSGLDDLSVGAIFRTIRWLPSYWFLGLYQQINGSMHPVLAPLAQRAWIGLACVVSGTAVIYALSYWRTLPRIAEEPDIAPVKVRLHWLPPFGSQPQTAIGQFSVRALIRSRQHRLILAFYLGIGAAITTMMIKGAPGSATNPYAATGVLLWASSILMIVLAAVGTRVAFAVPLDLRANWIFRIVGVRGGVESLTASRRSLVLLAVAPVWILTAAACLWLWPDRESWGHLAVLGLLGLILADACLLKFRKIPFTCSWLPGKTRMNLAFFWALGLLLIGNRGFELERYALKSTGRTILMLALMAAVWIGVRRVVVSLARNDEQDVQYEEEPPAALQGLGLYRDGVLPDVSPASRGD
ncbi:MAG: beta-lactamase family protein, partial [Acidobacteriia bacterium]|nr:beta-lactamase family protein [Terriglobia bacterium]